MRRKDGKEKGVTAMTVRQAARKYSVAVRTIRQWIREGKLVAEKTENGYWDVKGKAEDVKHE